MSRLSIKAEERIRKIKKQMRPDTLEICMDRARLVTESYMETEGQPAIIRRAKALARVLSKMSIYILDGELIVGNCTSKPMAGKLFPELGVRWIETELDSFQTRIQDPWVLSEEHKKELEDRIIPYWKGKTVEDRTDALTPKNLMDLQGKLWGYSLGRCESGAAHFAPDYVDLFKLGLGGLKKEVENKLDALDFTYRENLLKIDFYRAVGIILDGVIHFSNRYAGLAKELAANEPDLQRKAELLQIAANCDRVPENPPSTYYEALQFIWIITIALVLESGGPSNSVGRMDQFLYPFYRKDIDEGKISQMEAQELLDSFWCKFIDITNVSDAMTATGGAGFPVWTNINLGGQKRDGSDASNALSHMCLDADSHVGFSEPDIWVRIHKDTPDGFLHHVCKVIKEGRGKPPLMFDEGVYWRALDKKKWWGKKVEKSGISIEDIRDYCVIGCAGVTLAGKWYDMWEHSFILGGFGLYLELALNNGKSRLTGEQLGPETGDPKKFTSFDDVMTAYKKQVDHALKFAVVPKYIIDIAHRELAPVPFRSALTKDAINEGVDCTWFTEKKNMGLVHYSVGAANLGDSLAAIKKLVFEEKVISMPELIDALDRNFEGREDIRSMLLNKAPKYGNDIEYVDDLVKEAVSYESEVCQRYPNMDGAGTWAVTGGIVSGHIIGATPDGRKAGEPLAEGGMSPYQGRDQEGPTAAMRSVARAELDSIYNIRLNPAVFKGEDGLEKLMGLIRGYDELGGWQVQFNVVNAQDLKDAQRHPEKHRDLLVRVAGYSAYFTLLNTEIQDDIIRRTEHVF